MEELLLALALTTAASGLASLVVEAVRRVREGKRDLVSPRNVRVTITDSEGQELRFVIPGNDRLRVEHEILSAIAKGSPASMPTE